MADALVTKLRIKSVNVAGTEFESSRFMAYRERMDFTGALYPVRVLTLSLDSSDVIKINEKSYLDGEMKKCFVVKMIMEQVVAENDTPVGDPFDLSGEYIGYFRDTRIHSLMSEAVTATDQSKVVNSSWTPARTPYEVILMRKNETAIGNKSLVNFNMTSGKVFDAFFAGFSQSCSGLKILASSPKSNATVKNFLVPPIGFIEYLEMLESEFGFYNTPYVTWLENGLFYLLNTNNSHDISVKKMSTYKINVVEPDNLQNTFKFTADEVTVNLPSSNLKIRRSVSGNEPNSYYYKMEDGSVISKPGNSRQYQIIEKSNSTPKITPINPLQREVCEIGFNNFSFSNVTPLTYFVVKDLDGNINKYRVASVDRVIQGVDKVTMAVKLFRNLNEK